MGVYDHIEGAPEGYDDQVKCWPDLCLAMRAKGATVPPIDGHTSYSVLYNNHGGLPARYWIVSNSMLVNVNAEAPAAGLVFDKWGDRIEDKR